MTFLFTDIEGSTALLRALGDAAYADALAGHHRLIRDVTARHGGVEVNTEGDAFLLAFVRPADAIGAAVDMQRALMSHTWPEAADVRVRMGIHRGLATVSGDDYVSLAIHQTARVVNAAHGQQVLVSDEVEELTRGSLGDHVAVEDLGGFVVRDFDEPVHLFQVRHPDLPSTFPPPRVPSAAVHNLPPQRTGFVGRGFELGEATKTLQVAPLVTLLGPGGMGKTRLACEVGLAVAGDYPGGVWFVPLADIIDEALVASAIASVIGVKEDLGRDVIASLAARLQERPTMLILDNCEHVIEGCAAVVDQLLGVCTQLAVLATSREALGLVSEHVLRLAPLAVPGSARDAGDVSGFESVRLFVQRAHQVDSTFDVDDTNAADIAAICASLEGIPLALELAAARLASLSLAEIRERLGDALSLLAGGRRGGDPRLRTLEAAIGWSHRLLDEPEHVVFRRLSVFRGGFTLDAARTVANVAWPVTESIEKLRTQSLLEPMPDTDPPRFVLLEPIRQYARARLVEADETEDAETAHVRWALVVAASDDARTPPGLARCDAEHDNLRAALDVAATDALASRAVELVDALSYFWEMRGHWAEAAHYLDAVLTLDVPGGAQAMALERRSRFALLHGDYAEADAALANAFAIYERVGDESALVSCHCSIALLRLRLGRFAEGRAHYEEALTIARRIDDRDAIARCRFGLAELAFMESDYASAEAHYDAALSRDKEVNARHRIANCLSGLGQVAAARGEADRARTLYEQSLTIMEEIGNRLGATRCRYAIADLSYQQRDWEAARNDYTDALAVYEELGDAISVACCLLGLGEVANALGDPTTAVDLLQRSVADFTAMGDLRGAAHATYGIADARRLAGDGAAACETFEHALRLFEQVGERRGIANATRRLGIALHGEGEIEEGARLVTESLQQLTELGVSLTDEEQAEVDALLSHSET